MLKSTLAFSLLFATTLMGVSTFAQSVGQEAKISLPFHATPEGNALYVEGRLNGHPAIFLLDTGSTFSFCDWKLCGKTLKTTASLDFGTWHSSEQEVRTRDFSEISRKTGIKVDGILGLLTMNLFRRVIFNFEASMLELEPR